MALANTACLLAAAGHRVLAIDWDLEAPGLHRYLHPFLADPNLTKTSGLIDLALDYVAAAARTGSADGRHFNPLSLADPAHIAIPTSFPMEGSSARGCLHMVGAGIQNSVYADRVRNFDWAAMFLRLDGATFIRQFGEKCRAAYDFTLIDSRTGIADAAGIATIVLPDRVVLCFTPNRQSVLGIRAISESIIKARPLLRLLPVVTRVEKGVEGWREAQTFYRSQLDHLLPTKASDATRAAYWGTAEIVHYPNYALGELLATFCDLPTEQNSLLSEMRRLVSRIVESDFMSLRNTFAAPEFSQQARMHYLRRVQFRDPRIADLQAALDGDPSSGLIAVLSLAAESRETDFDTEWLKELASTLNTLVIRLAGVGRREEALTCAREAAGLYRELARARPEAFTPDLALSLNTLAAMLSELGRREEALTCAQEAVAIRRELARARPEAFTSDLALSLNTLAAVLSELGRREEALTCAQEAACLYRELARARPEAFTPDLALSLNTLAAMLSELQIAEALAAAKAIGDEWYRAEALGALASQLSAKQIAEALVVAKAIGDERYRAHALGSLAPYASPIQYAALLNSLVEAAARIPRSQALTAMSESMHISAALGGTEGLESIHRAISDTAHWYP